MISSIVFSKNRPLQLDLTIKSIKHNFKQCNNIVVLYNVDNAFKESYNILKNEYTDVRFIKQTSNFFINCLDALYFNNSNRYICLFTDDNIVFDTVQTTKDDLDTLFNNMKICTLSLRLGVNINKRDFGLGKLEPDKQPTLSRVSSRHLIWNRTEMTVGGYWNYPLSVDGHIYHWDFISFMFHTINGWPESNSGIRNPNSLETYMQRFFFECSPLMACECTSKVVNSPNNRVQSLYENRFGDTYSFDADYLNSLFLEGKRLNMFDVNKIECPHQELDILCNMK